MAEGPGESWLVHEGQVLASVERARTRSERRRGLLGRDRLDGVLVIPTKAVHTIGMRMAIDVAFCDSEGRVLHVTTMAPNRVGGLHLRATHVIEAPAGSFRAWGIGPGDVVELR